MKITFSSFIALPLLLICILAYAQKNTDRYVKQDDGILIRLEHNGLRLIKLSPVTNNTIHVMASPRDSFSSAQSLMISGEKHEAVKWSVDETTDFITLHTAAINAKVILKTGEVSFTDKNGQALLQETKNGGKIFSSTIIDGAETFALRQSFQTTDDEAFYGLGQHQNGVMNYKNSQVQLLNYNTDVAIPFLVSSKNYGILWDNYSITNVMDDRSFEPLSTLKLFAADGQQGWLTATYSSSSNPSQILITRAESVISYDFISSLKRLPDSIKLDKATVKWAGSIASDFTGSHTFMFRYSGYAKIWINGKLLADRWRHSWNPGTALLHVDMEIGKKYDIKIEWNPDGSSESFISCNWLKPLAGEQKNKFAFGSEAGTQIDYYFIAGKNMDDVIGSYRTLTGKATILPKWAMGFWQSRERYKTQDEIMNTVAEFRKRKIPLDNIVEDWSYWKPDQWGSQQFDESRFPDATGMIKKLHDTYHTQFMISVWPKFYEGIENYNLLDKSGFLYKRNVANRQRDWIGKGYVNTFYDAFNPLARNAFWATLNISLYKKGVDAWWLDASEPDINSNMSVEERKQMHGPTALGSSTQYFNGYPLQHAKGVYENQRLEDPNKRVFILTRSAYAGMQRYAAATWSGDVASRWEDFKNQIPAGINFSMSGMPYWTTDIGGFAVEHRYEKPNGKDLDEWQEQMTRWYQFGAFCPLFRVHGQFPYREIFNVSAENETPYKSMLYYDKLRYRLMPYIYSLAQQTYHNNYTIMRGLPMDFDQDKAVNNIADQYMFGPAFMVNPITDYKSRSRSVYLPGGNGWYNFATGKYENGGQYLNVDAPLEQIPLFIKEGSIVPVGPALQYVAEKPADPITLFVYTGKDATFDLYEDEATNYNYEKGMFSVIKFTYNEAKKTMTIGERKGSFLGMLQQRTFKVVWVDKTKPLAFDAEAKPSAVIHYSGKEVNAKKVM